MSPAISNPASGVVLTPSTVGTSLVAGTASGGTTAVSGSSKGVSHTRMLSQSHTGIVVTQLAPGNIALRAGGFLGNFRKYTDYMYLATKSTFLLNLLFI